MYLDLMKRYNAANETASQTASQTTSQTTSQMIGQLIEPVSVLKTESLETEAGEFRQKRPCYRLEKLLDREVGKRTFLATDVHSSMPVVIKLLLYCPDPQEKEIEDTLLQQQETGVQTYELSSMLSYLDSFEVETALGIALVLVKPYSHQSAIHQSVAHHSTGHRSRTAQMRRSAAASTSRRVTVTPQTTYADFRIKSVADKFSVQFLESRICVGIIPDQGISDRLEIWLLAIVGTIIFVGGAVAITGSTGLGIAIAMLLPILFRRITTPKRDRRTVRRQATVRLSNELNGRTFLSLTSALMPRRDRAGKINASPIESKLHYSRLSVKSVTVAPAFFVFSNGYNLFGAKLTFTFYNHDAPSSGLCVVGSYQEIRWIHRHLLQWAKLGSSNSL